MPVTFTKIGETIASKSDLAADENWSDPHAGWVSPGRNVATRI
jgi:hypothetical protein